MDLVSDIAAIRTPLPQPGTVTPAELYDDAFTQAQQTRLDDAEDLQAQCDGLEEDPLLIALNNARARKEAADAEIRQLLAYGREFHGDHPYKLEPLAQASGMTPSGIRTAYTTGEIENVAREIGRRPNSRRTRPPSSRERS